MRVITGTMGMITRLGLVAASDVLMLRGRSEESHYCEHGFAQHNSAKVSGTTYCRKNFLGTTVTSEVRARAPAYFFECADPEPR